MSILGTLNGNALQIALFLGIGVLLAVIALVVFIWNSKRVVRGEDNRDAFTIIYDSVIHTDEEAFAEKMKVNVPEYMQNCHILGIEPNLKSVCAKKATGMVSILVGAVLFVLSGSLLALALAALGAFFIFWPERDIRSKADKKKEEIKLDLPRFLDLLQTALKAGMPISDALRRTAESVDCVLSDEILKSFTDVKVGAATWQSALYKLASLYGIDALSEFVMSIVTAYDKGVPILDAVESESRRLKNDRLLDAKDKATKISSYVTFPIMIFDIMPLMLLLIYPYLGILASGIV